MFSYGARGATEAPCRVPVKEYQSRMSCDRSTSSTDQKLATAFLYIW